MLLEPLGAANPKVLPVFALHPGMVSALQPTHELQQQASSQHERTGRKDTDSLQARRQINEKLNSRYFFRIIS